MELYKIYILLDPITQQVRYVGQTKQNPHARYTYHVNEKKNNKKNQWIRSLKEKGFKPEIEVIDFCYTLEDCNKLEIFWIAYFKFVGARLTNVTSGGNQPKGHKLTKEHIEKIRSKTIGQKRSEETKKLLSEKAKNRDKNCYKNLIEISKKRPPEVLQKLREARSKWYYSLTKEERSALYAKRTENVRKSGYKISEETRQKLRNKSKRPCSEETKQKIRLKLLGKKHSPERIVKFREGLIKSLKNKGKHRNE